MTPEFLLTSLVVVLIPGTGVIYTVSTGLFLGGRASLMAALGCTLGIVPHLLASILGLSAILHMSALAFQAIKYAGALYLLYLAWGMWHDRGSLAFKEGSGATDNFRIIVRGIALNLLNPKLTIFFLSFLPLFVAPEGANPLLQMLLLSGVFMGMTFLVFVFYGLCAHGFRQFIVGSPRILKRLRRSFALAFGALGLRLAMAER